MTYIDDKDVEKIVYRHYLRLYGSHSQAIDAMLVDLVGLEQEENYEQCQILLDTIKRYE